MCECTFGLDCVINNQTFKHECYDWDGLLIDINTPEISGCTCFYSTVSWL